MEVDDDEEVSAESPNLAVGGGDEPAPLSTDALVERTGDTCDGAAEELAAAAFVREKVAILFVTSACIIPCKPGCAALTSASKASTAVEWFDKSK